MFYYVVRFIGSDMFFRSRNLLVGSVIDAKRFSSRIYARKAVKKSSFAELDFEIWEMSC